LPVLLERDEDIVVFVKLYNDSVLMARLDLCRLLRWLSQFLAQIKKLLLEVHIENDALKLLSFFVLFLSNKLL
jgi:hypothetical protein